MCYIQSKANYLLRLTIQRLSMRCSMIHHRDKNFGVKLLFPSASQMFRKKWHYPKRVLR